LKTKYETVCDLVTGDGRTEKFGEIGTGFGGNQERNKSLSGLQVKSKAKKIFFVWRTIIDFNEAWNSFISMDSLPEEVSNQINEFFQMFGLSAIKRFLQQKNLNSQTNEVKPFLNSGKCL
jgi:hypothetical protein